MKKLILEILFFGLLVNLFAVGSLNQKKFVKGTVTDKTDAVRSASEQEVIDLAKAAIEFSINYKDLLGPDKELSDLAIAGVESISEEYLVSASDQEKNVLMNKFLTLYGMFTETNVRAAVLKRFASGLIPADKMIAQLNVYIKSVEPAEVDPELLKTVLLTAGKIGTEETFEILFRVSAEKNWNGLKSEAEKALTELSKPAEQKILEIISSGNVQDCRRMFELVTKNPDVDQVFSAQIAENVLSRTIYIYENSTKVSEDLIPLQLESFELLKNAKWTRASNTAVRYLKNASTEYNQGMLSEENFCSIIEGVTTISPIGSIQPLSGMIVVLNRQKESNEKAPSEAVLLSLINSLGEAGDKNAFDALLSVTYYEYPERVIAAARNALAKLKW